MNLFGRKRSPALTLLKGARWKCAQCEEEHRGMFDLGARAPDHWGEVETIEPNSALRRDGDFLSQDFCVLGGAHFFVRCVAEIPVHGMAEKFGFGAWSTLSRANFDIYVGGFDSGRFADDGPWSGWFGNRIKTFEDAKNQPCLVFPQPGNQRPTLALQDGAHELAIAQRDGMTPERLLDLYAAYGHGPQAG